MRLETDNPTIADIRSRRSIRRFTGEPVGDEAVRAVLDSGRWAPSGLNNQPCRFLVVKGADPRREKIAPLTKYSSLIRSADILIAVFIDNSASYNTLRDHQAAGAAIQNMLLAAHSLGLGAVWIGQIANRAEEVVSALDLSEKNLSLVAVVAMGHPAESPDPVRHPLTHFLLEDFTCPSL